MQSLEDEPSPCVRCPSTGLIHEKGKFRNCSCARFECIQCGSKFYIDICFPILFQCQIQKVTVTECETTRILHISCEGGIHEPPFLVPGGVGGIVPLF